MGHKNSQNTFSTLGTAFISIDYKWTETAQSMRQASIVFVLLRSIGMDTSTLDTNYLETEKNGD